MRAWSRCWLRRQSQVREWVLGRKTSVVNGIKLCRRRNFGAGTQDGVKEVEHLCAVNGVVPGNKDEHVAGRDDFFLIVRRCSFFGGRKRMISSGVMSGRSISSMCVLMWSRTGDMREPEKLNEAFRMVCVPVILLRSSAVSYWLGAKATRTWQLLTMLSLRPYSSTIWRMSCVMRYAFRPNPAM